MMMGKVDDIAAAGVTHVWLPPPSHSVSNEGFPPVPPSFTIPQN
jgi:alpha-amylase